MKKECIKSSAMKIPFIWVILNQVLGKDEEREYRPLHTTENQNIYYHT